VHKTYKKDQSPFYKLNNKKRLAKILGVSPHTLNKVLKDTDKHRAFNFQVQQVS
jgi:hypothetical protein